MRVFVTGATGFVGRWLAIELEKAGHQVVPAPGPDELEITDTAALTAWFRGAGGPPDGVVHLAGVAFAPDASADPVGAFRTNVGGTVSLFEALRAAGIRPAVLVAGSSDVYGRPAPADLPLAEASPLAPASAYGLSKCAQEAVAVEASLRYGLPVTVTRSFNHTGPGQRPVFVVPAMAERAVAVRDGRAKTIRAGNVDVRRDISDVRDVVRAYRLLLERSWADGSGGSGTSRPRSTPLVVNVASGAAIAIRDVVGQLCQLVGVEGPIEVDPLLVRPDDPVEIRGDATLLHDLTGWAPSIPLRQTLSDLLAGLTTGSDG